MGVGCRGPRHEARLPAGPRDTVEVMPGHADITIRNSHGDVVGRVARADDGSLRVEVHDERSRWLVELAAARAGAPAHPRPRASCSAPSAAPRGGPPGLTLNP